MAQQTAVDWYVIEHRKLLIQLESKELSLRKYVVKHQYVLKKANKMFEEQVKKAWTDGQMDSNYNIIDGEDYYNEAYGK